MNEKELAIYIKQKIINTQKELKEQYEASYFKLFKEPFINIDVKHLIIEGKNIGIKIQYAQKSKFYRNFKNDNYQTIIAYLND